MSYNFPMSNALTTTAARITINSVEYVIESADRAPAGHEVLILRRMGKRGALLAASWLATRTATGRVTAPRLWV